MAETIQHGIADAAQSVKQAIDSTTAGHKVLDVVGNAANSVSGAAHAALNTLTGRSSTDQNPNQQSDNAQQQQGQQNQQQDQDKSKSEFPSTLQQQLDEIDQKVADKPMHNESADQVKHPEKHLRPEQPHFQDITDQRKAYSLHGNAKMESHWQEKQAFGGKKEGDLTIGEVGWEQPQSNHQAIKDMENQHGQALLSDPQKEASFANRFQHGNQQVHTDNQRKNQHKHAKQPS
jgi:hypothetical protein